MTGWQAGPTPTSLPPHVIWTNQSCMKDRQLLWFGLAIFACVLLKPLSSGAADSRAEEELKKKVAEREANVAQVAQTKANAPAIRLATPPELERLYLDGRITAKEYQRKLAEYKASVASLTNRTPEAQALEALRKDAKSTPQPPAQVQSKTAAPASRTAQTNGSAPADKKFTEVEAKFDELIQKKTEREKVAQAARTNAPPAAPKTKREKLDALLKALIDGRLSEKDYTEQRTKVINEPD